MKKIITLVLIAVFSLCSFMTVPVDAKADPVITSFEAASSNGHITAEGTAEDGILAVVLIVYEGEELIYLKSCPCDDGQFMCQLGIDFEPGTYTVKAAPYEGGAYMSQVVEVEKVISPDPDPDPIKDDVEKPERDGGKPNTGDSNDMLPWIALLLMAGTVFAGTVAYKRRKN